MERSSLILGFVATILASAVIFGSLGYYFGKGAVNSTSSSPSVSDQAIAWEKFSGDTYHGQKPVDWDFDQSDNRVILAPAQGIEGDGMTITIGPAEASGEVISEDEITLGGKSATKRVTQSNGNTVITYSVATEPQPTVISYSASARSLAIIEKVLDQLQF